MKYLIYCNLYMNLEYKDKYLKYKKKYFQLKQQLGGSSLAVETEEEQAAAAKEQRRIREENENLAAYATGQETAQRRLQPKAEAEALPIRSIRSYFRTGKKRRAKQPIPPQTQENDRKLTREEQQAKVVPKANAPKANVWNITDAVQDNEALTYASVVRTHSDNTTSQQRHRPSSLTASTVEEIPIEDFEKRRPTNPEEVNSWLEKKNLFIYAYSPQQGFTQKVQILPHQKNIHEVGGIRVSNGKTRSNRSRTPNEKHQVLSSVAERRNIELETEVGTNSIRTILKPEHEYKIFTYKPYVFIYEVNMFATTQKAKFIEETENHIIVELLDKDYMLNTTLSTTVDRNNPGRLLLDKTKIGTDWRPISYIDVEREKEKKEKQQRNKEAEVQRQKKEESRRRNEAVALAKHEAAKQNSLIVKDFENKLQTYFNPKVREDMLKILEVELKHESIIANLKNIKNVIDMTKRDTDWDKLTDSKKEEIEKRFKQKFDEANKIYDKLVSANPPPDQKSVTQAEDELQTAKEKAIEEKEEEEKKALKDLQEKKTVIFLETFRRNIDKLKLQKEQLSATAAKQAKANRDDDETIRILKTDNWELQGTKQGSKDKFTEATDLNKTTHVVLYNKKRDAYTDLYEIESDTSETSTQIEVYNAAKAKESLLHSLNERNDSDYIKIKYGRPKDFKDTGKLQLETDTDPVLVNYTKLKEDSDFLLIHLPIWLEKREDGGLFKFVQARDVQYYKNNKSLFFVMKSIMFELKLKDNKLETLITLLRKKRTEPLNDYKETRGFFINKIVNYKVLKDKFNSLPEADQVKYTQGVDSDSIDEDYLTNVLQDYYKENWNEKEIHKKRKKIKKNLKIRFSQYKLNGTKLEPDLFKNFYFLLKEDPIPPPPFFDDENNILKNIYNNLQRLHNQNFYDFFINLALSLKEICLKLKSKSLDELKQTIQNYFEEELPKIIWDTNWKENQFILEAHEWILQSENLDAPDELKEDIKSYYKREAKRKEAAAKRKKFEAKMQGNTTKGRSNKQRNAQLRRAEEEEDKANFITGLRKRLLIGTFKPKIGNEAAIAVINRYENNEIKRQELDRILIGKSTTNADEGSDGQQGGGLSKNRIIKDWMEYQIIKDFSKYLGEINLEQLCKETLELENYSQANIVKITKFRLEHNNLLNDRKYGADKISKLSKVFSKFKLNGDMIEFLVEVREKLGNEWGDYVNLLEENKLIRTPTRDELTEVRGLPRNQEGSINSKYKVKLIKL